MREILHVLYVILLIFIMTFFFLKDDICGVCFIGFLLINARFNERYGEEK